MANLGDKLLALIAYKAARLYLRRRYGRFVPSRRATLGGLLGVVLVGAAIAAARRLSGSSTG